MKFTAIEVRALSRKSGIAQAFYEVINARMGGILAPSETLLKAVQSPSIFLAWLDGDRTESQQWTATYHYVEPLSSEAIETNEFLVRAVKRQTDGGRMRCNILLQGDQRLTSVRLDFNGRFNLAFAGHCLKDLRDYLTEQGISWDSIDLSAEGYIGEAHIKEAMLAAFEWDEVHGHMLHKRGEMQQRRTKNQR